MDGQTSGRLGSGGINGCYWWGIQGITVSIGRAHKAEGRVLCEVRVMCEGRVICEGRGRIDSFIPPVS